MATTKRVAGGGPLTVPAAAILALAIGCDPLSSLDGRVRSAGDCSGLPEKGIAGAVLTVRCPDERASTRQPIQSDETGHFLHGYISWDNFDDACIIHVEREGYESADVPVRLAKVGEDVRSVFVVLRLKHSEKR
jgi:hypothetical protein